VHVVRFLIEGSIEERLVALQSMKEAVGKGAVEKLNEQEKRRAKLATLGELFEISDNLIESYYSFD
jgi:SNF2 family DNA or RNA helicase